MGERIVEYCSVPTEEDIINEHPDEAKTVPPEQWPFAGAIYFDNLSMRYRADLPLVLQNVECNIQAGERIGIVGRTGSGKSSLLVCLFRLVSFAGGRVLIDNVDLSKTPLRNVRSKIAIIPQDPQLFCGTIRTNLDPFGTATDAALWTSLGKVSLSERIHAMPDQLEAVVAEQGENFSVGERQLLCMARALLRDSKVVVMDEATASVDAETDALIQRTVRESLSHCTVLTIAHRLNTIVDSDRIMVMHEGRLVECDTPASLLSEDSPTQYFAQMVDETGRRTARHLRRAAARAALGEDGSLSPSPLSSPFSESPNASPR
eukprot:NODE_329_length_1041_cov_810.517137_g265_i0.p1 GENE.NODE_329_length_1041_cov_810.517137_g265_i0~~NODE_329_length_1041_cov_810.517137_g265_i0.p1  ORF type:complete len:329 (-),score=64.01 NODE_329_length_1041_cov_810.517137_g265_i0:55-1011(-)